jgi:hypothetical protein
MRSLLGRPVPSSHPVDVGQRTEAIILIDLFLVHCPDTDRVYALDVEEAAASQARLRVEPTANGQAKGVRWAADHELPA